MIYIVSTMRNPTFVIVSAILLSLAAVSQAGALDDAAPYSVIDGIIKALLGKLRPVLANLKFGDIDEVVNNEKVQATVKVTDILIQHADTFRIDVLKSNIVPLKLSNLTLTWNNVTASAKYDVNAKVSISNLTTINIHGKGEAKAVLNQIFFTIGANVELKGATIQIKPRGLFGFDARIGSADVTFTNLMGSPEFGSAVGKFFSRLIPDTVETFRKFLFDLFQDDIIKILNKILSNHKEGMMDEGTSDSEESNEIFSELFDWDSSEFEGEF